MRYISIALLVFLSSAIVRGADLNKDLRNAASKGDIAKVTALLKNSTTAIDINSVDGKGNTALWLAVDGGHAAIVTLLLEHRADPNMRGKWSTGSDKQALRPSPLITAAGKANADIVRQLMAAGADVSAVAKISWTHDECEEVDISALARAAATGQAEVARLLIAAGARVDIENKLGCTPLILALRGQETGHAEVADLLIDSGADADRSDALLVWPSSVFLMSLDGQRLNYSKPLGVFYNNNGTVRNLGKAFFLEPDGRKLDVVHLQQRQFVRLAPGPHKASVAFAAIDTSLTRYTGEELSLDLSVEVGERFTVRPGVDATGKQWIAAVEKHERGAARR